MSEEEKREEKRILPAIVLIPIGLGLGAAAAVTLYALARAAPPAVFICPHCEATFDTEEELAAHIQQEHAMIILEPNGDGDIIELAATELPHWQMVLHEDTIFYMPDEVHYFGHFEGYCIAKSWWPSEWQTDLFTFTDHSTHHSISRS